MCLNIMIAHYIRKSLAEKKYIFSISYDVMLDFFFKNNICKINIIGVEDILNHVIPHSLNHVCEQCEEFENFRFKKK